MGKEKIVNRISESIGITKAQAARAWESASAAIATELLQNNSVIIPGVGVLKPIVRPARLGRNPQNGEEIEIPERPGLKISASKNYIAAKQQIL